MSLGLFFRLTDEQVAPLINFTGDGEDLLELIGEMEEEYWDFACEIDKAWDPINCSLNPKDKDEPLGPKGVIGGARGLLDDNDLGWVTHLNPSEVSVVSEYLEGLSDEEFVKLYEAMPEDLRELEYGPDELEYSLGWLSGLRDFYTEAASAGQHVIFSVSF
ncbi:MAG: DUF1877 family protein [Corynebacterium sp.]|uniref:DUF1877 family protein n=1 Tax=Corynebacterium sp. TaxID=1720 RepID=UPI0026DC10FB|nr:DUF1877 family protein [Corynebacterium sp.]MDO5098355.1 DUF1877 family protein [Corynebacterium sp.]